MNTRTFVKLSALLFFFGATLAAEAQWGWQNGWNRGQGYYTGGNYGWAGWGPGRGPRVFKPMGTVSINADFNYDGLIRGLEGRNLKMTPPGLVIGTDEMSKVSLSCVPDPIWLPKVGDPKVNMKFHKLALILDVRGVDLGKKNGQFRSIEKEIEKCGRVLVWADKTRKHLLLDSSDPSKRRLVWAYADSVPPPYVYVEGANAAQPGGAYLITWELDDSYGQNAFQRFFGDPSVWDRLMVSIRPTGFDKPLIDNDPVWIKFSKPAYSKN